MSHRSKEDITRRRIAMGVKISSREASYLTPKSYDEVIKEVYSHMKKYFAAYTPIEGKIKVGDNYLFGPSNEILVCKDEEEAERCNNDFIISKNCKKTQLSLCSIEKQEFKVIGKISPDALWVNEFDKFDEDEVRYEYADNLWYIQCSQCNTYH